MMVTKLGASLCPSPEVAVFGNLSKTHLTLHSTARLEDDESRITQD